MFKEARINPRESLVLEVHLPTSSNHTQSDRDKSANIVLKRLGRGNPRVVVRGDIQRVNGRRTNTELENLMLVRQFDKPRSPTRWNRWGLTSERK